MICGFHEYNYTSDNRKQGQLERARSWLAAGFADMEAAYPFCAAVCHNIVDKGLHVSLSLSLSLSLSHTKTHTHKMRTHTGMSGLTLST